jgi:hypothetical protein
MSVWTERDLPVLRFLNENPPSNDILWTNWRETSPHPDLSDLSEQDFHQAVETLADAGFVSFREGDWDSAGGVPHLDFQVTGAGKQVLGDWPLFEALGQPAALADVLEELSKTAPTDEEEANLQHAAADVRKFSAESLEQLAAGALAALARSLYS